MVAKENRSGFPNTFQRESLKLVNNLISLSGSAFYLVGADMRHRGVVAQDLDPLVERDYYKNFRALDPLNPARFENTEETVVTIDSQVSELKLLQTIYYQDFMKPNNHRYVADMFFRSHGRICAVLTMLRDPDGEPFNIDELVTLRTIQPFLEYALNEVYEPKRANQRKTFETTYNLTNRELDVLEHLMCGNSNKVIANELGLSLSTVKTHLQHMFKKTQAESRSELVSLALGQI